MPEDLNANPEIDNEFLLKSLNEWKDSGVLDYVLPTVPLGGEWVLGVPGLGMMKLRTQGEVEAFLTGAKAAAQWAAEKLSTMRQDAPAGRGRAW